jgi:hypothetical protein
LGARGPQFESGRPDQLVSQRSVLNSPGAFALVLAGFGRHPGCRGKCCSGPRCQKQVFCQHALAGHRGPIGALEQSSGARRRSEKVQEGRRSAHPGSRGAVDSDAARLRAQSILARQRARGQHRGLSWAFLAARMLPGASRQAAWTRRCCSSSAARARWFLWASARGEPRTRWGSTFSASAFTQC